MAPKAKKRTPKEQSARAQVRITSKDILVRVGTQLHRIGFETDIFKNGQVAEPKLLTTGLAQAFKELKLRTPTINISLPSSLFDLGNGEIDVPNGQNRTQIAQLNRSKIKGLSRDEYSDIAVDNVSQSESARYHALMATANRTTMLNIMTAIKASGARIISIEPQVTAELRTYAALYPQDSVTMLTVEKNASFIATLVNGNVVEIVREDGLENLLLTVHPDLNTAIERVAAGTEDLSVRNQTHIVTKNISDQTNNQINYAESLYTRADMQNHLVLGGELDVQGMAEVISNEMMQHYSTLPANSITGNLATEGLGLRPQLSDLNLAINMLTSQRKVASGLHPAVIPGLILTAGLGSYAYAAVRVSGENQRITAATAERDTLAPRVGEQTRLFDENQSIQKDIDRAKQLQSQGNDLPAEMRAIVNRIPAENVGIVTLQLVKENRSAREFNGMRINRSYQIEIQSRSQASTQEFIQAFEAAPYAISVTDITQLNDAGVQKVAAIIGVEAPPR